MSGRCRIIDVQWDENNSYRFFVDSEIRSMMEDGKRARFKDVYHGFFVDDDAPEGIEPGEVCWLKKIHVDSKMVYPQFREKYDLVEFPDPVNIRSFLTRNPRAKEVAEAVCRGEEIDAVDCYTVERPYSELVPDQIQYLTPFERIEYVVQYCNGLQEFYEKGTKKYGRTVVAHRDVKLGNGLIQREKDSFRVKLTDFSSLRFGGDTDSEMSPVEDRSAFNPSKGSQGTVQHLMSEDNTCIEIVSSKYPTTSAVDVFALGTMLAGMFGYVTPTCRNPNVYCCTDPVGGDHTKREKLEKTDLTVMLEQYLAVDRGLGPTYEGTTWMEKLLETKKTPFIWGDPEGAPYDLDGEFLQGVKDLFFQATHVDPRDRISFDQFCQRVHQLKSSITGKKPRRSNSPVLYMKNEHICLIHQSSLAEHRREIETAVENAIRSGGIEFPVQLCWYQNQKENKYSPEAEKIGRESIQTPERLKSIIHARNGNELLPGPTLTDAIGQLWSVYQNYRYEKEFQGTIHIFSAEPFDMEVFQKTQIGRREYTFAYMLGGLKEFAKNSLRIILHNPEEPTFVDDDWGYQWVPMSEGNRDPGTPDAPSAGSSGVSRRKEPAVVPELPVEKIYLLGSEGLFLLDQDGNKVFVTRKKMRR